MKSITTHSVTLLLLFFGATVTAGTVAQSPLFLTTSAEPNIMLMVDNSGSMNNIVPDKPYDANTTYIASCPGGNLVPAGSPVDIHIVSSQPRIYYSGSTYELGTGSGQMCFDTTSSYSARLFANDGTEPVWYLDAEYTGNYLNWYFDANNTTPTWTSGLQKKPGTQTRMEIAKTSTKTLVDSLENVRLGLSTYQYNGFNTLNGGSLREIIGDLDNAKKTAIKSKIDALSANGVTPIAETLSDIGRYFATGYSGNLTLHPGQANESTASVADIFNNHTIRNDSGQTIANPIQYSCQKNFSVLMTDGRSQADEDISNSFADYDGDCAVAGANCGSYDQKPGPTYESDGSDYLDDVAQALFEVDLRPDLVDQYGIKNNLITYTVGFADINVQNDPLIQQAATQGGGQFYFAENATELSTSLSSVFNGIAEQAKSSAAAVATNSTQYQSDSLIYQATFDSEEWGGHLLALELTTEDINGNGTLDAGEDANGNGKIDVGSIGAQQWDAAENIPSETNRKIYTYDPSATGSKGLEFLWNDLNASQQQVLGSTAIVDYLRGDQSQEITNGGNYRNRSIVLGDIVNSDPLFIGRDNFGYAKLAGTEGSSYAAFATTSRREMIYVGANDGMLHGFDASNGADGGKEIFAYLPNMAISAELVSLSSSSYTHQFFVDGSAQAGDVFFNGAWHTVLVGSMGAGTTTEVAATKTDSDGNTVTDLPTGTGGRGIFALDVTDPDSFDASKVLWEFSSRDDSDLGYTIPETSVVRMANGQWAAIVPNGYNSNSGKAILFIINIETGAVIKKIEAEVSTGSNGLSTPVAVDVDYDQIVDYIYAGDLKGNMWKFDVSNSEVANWGVAYGGSPLYVALDEAATPKTQPITSKPAVAKVTAKGQTSGIMVYFGTGKYYETGDDVVPASPQVETFYGIWDVCDKTTPTTCNGNVSGRSLLQEQAIVLEGASGITTLADGTTVVDENIRITSDCEVAYDSSIPSTTASPCTNNTNRRGWFMDLIPPSSTAVGERVVSKPVVRNGRIIFTTLIPITAVCSPGGTGWLMELDQKSGARLATTPFDLSGDDIVSSVDQVTLIVNGTNVTVAASGLKSKVGIIQTPAIIQCEGDLDCKYASGSSGSIMEVKESIPPNPPCTGASCVPGPVGGPARRSWIQLR